MRLLLALLAFVAVVPALAAPPAEPACIAELAKVARMESATSPETDDEGCVIPTPVKVEAFTYRDREVKLSGAPVLHCPFALAFARWTRDVAAPLAEGELDRKLVELGTGNGFQCRRRNRAKTGKLSEHAFGNAIDIVTFRFDGEGDEARFDVQPYEDMSAEEVGYLDAVRKSACGYFTTILGPGSNAAHADHLHFDLGRQYKDGEKRDNPYRICD